MKGRGAAGGVIWLATAPVLPHPPAPPAPRPPRCRHRPADAPGLALPALRGQPVQPRGRRRGARPADGRGERRPRRAARPLPAPAGRPLPGAGLLPGPRVLHPPLQARRAPPPQPPLLRPPLQRPPPPPPPEPPSPHLPTPPAPPPNPPPGRVHEHNLAALFAAALPYHATPEFARLAAVCGLKGTIWEWLAPIQDSGAPLPRPSLVQRCVRDRVRARRRRARGPRGRRACLLRAGAAPCEPRPIGPRRRTIRAR
jgi:hypothetical protein